MASIKTAISKAFAQSGFPLDCDPTPNPRWFSKNANGIEFCNQFVEVVDGYEIIRLGELVEWFAEFISVIGNAQQGMNIDMQMQRRSIFLDLIKRFGFDDATGAEVALTFCMNQSIQPRPEVASDEEIKRAKVTAEILEAHKAQVAAAQAIYDKAIAIFDDKKAEILEFSEDQSFEAKIKQLITMRQTNPSQRFANIYSITGFLKDHCKYRYEDLPDGTYEAGEVEKYLLENQLLNLNGEPRRAEVDLDIADIMNFPRKLNEKLMAVVEKDISGAPLTKVMPLSESVPEPESEEELKGKSNSSKKQKAILPEETEQPTTTKLLAAV
jgi:hypothetical protein